MRVGVSEVVTVLFSDINECTISNGGCEQNCNNTEGSFYCFCDSGFTLDPNQSSCNG